MSESSLSPDPNADTPALGIEDHEAFSALLAEYDRAIARISTSHDSLRKKVADLSEEIELKNRLLARQERLAALGEMAAGVAHEIRNPLGGIALYLELLQKDLAGNDAPLAICGKIGNAVGRLNHIVEAILNFTRSFEPRQQKIDARGLIDEVVEIASPIAREHQVEVALNVTDDADGLEGDSSMLHQLLLNLVRNAIEASPKDGQVQISAARRSVKNEEGDQHRLCIQISDQGEGIPEDLLPKLFTPFFTTKKGGTGLGLALCQRIAEAHHGELHAHNTQTSGAVFELTLPVQS